MTSSSGSALLAALLLVPLLGAIVVILVRDNDRLAKQIALAFGCAELVLVFLSWIAYEPGGARLQQHFSFDWIPTFGVHVSFGIDGIALVMIASIALLVPLLVGASWMDKLPQGIMAVASSTSSVASQGEPAAALSEAVMADVFRISAYRAEYQREAVIVPWGDI